MSLNLHTYRIQAFDVKPGRRSDEYDAVDSILLMSPQILSHGKEFRNWGLLSGATPPVSNLTLVGTVQETDSLGGFDDVPSPHLDGDAYAHASVPSSSFTGVFGLIALSPDDDDSPPYSRPFYRLAWGSGVFTLAYAPLEGAVTCDVGDDPVSVAFAPATVTTVIAFLWEDNRLRIYRDGSLAAELSKTAPPSGSTFTLKVGGDVDAGFIGAVDFASFGTRTADPADVLLASSLIRAGTMWSPRLAALEIKEVA